MVHYFVMILALALSSLPLDITRLKLIAVTSWNIVGILTGLTVDSYEEMDWWMIGISAVLIYLQTDMSLQLGTLLLQTFLISKTVDEIVSQAHDNLRTSSKFCNITGSEVNLFI